MDERGECSAFDFGLRQAKFLERGQRRKVRHALVLNVDVRQKMQAHVQFLEMRQAAQAGQLVVSIEFAAGVRVPHGAGEKQLAEVREVLEFDERFFVRRACLPD